MEDSPSSDSKGYRRISAAPVDGDTAELPLVKELRNLELLLVREALRRSNGNQTHAARLLGILRTTLCMRIRKMRQQGLMVDPPEQKGAGI